MSVSAWRRSGLALAVLVLGACRPAPPPVLWSLPHWQLMDQEGRAFGSRELAGKVWVADFVFTRCTSTCPVLTRTMARVQDLLGARAARVHLVSITVDPTGDSPEALQRYARRHRADPSHWTFVTGPESDVSALLASGFRVDVTAPPLGPDGGSDPRLRTHSNRFVVVDAQGRLRATQLMDEPDAVDRLLETVDAVLRE